MTDEQGLEGAREEQVRRLLAAARHDAPVPDDVAARVDAALAAERETVAVPADELASRRRRRRWAGGLVAAALVVVAGVGADAAGLLDSGSGSEAGSAVDGSSGSTDAGGGTEDRAEGGGDSRDGGDGGDGGPSGESGLGTLEQYSDEGRDRGSRPEVRSGPGFVADVDAAVRAVRGPQPRTATARCAPASAAGRVVPVRYDGRIADLVVTRGADGAVEVDVFTCGSDGLADRSTRLPAD